MKIERNSKKMKSGSIFCVNSELRNELQLLYWFWALRVVRRISLVAPRAAKGNVGHILSSSRGAAVEVNGVA